MAPHKIVPREEWVQIFYTYSTYGRGTEELLSTYAVDMMPKGPNETGPRHNLTDWVKRHEYDNGAPAAA